MPRPRPSSSRRRQPTTPSGAIGRLAHLALTLLDHLFSLLFWGLWLSSLLVTLPLATLLHFLEYCKSYRANDASMFGVALPLESAKGVLVYAFKVIPYVSKTFELLAKAVIIPVVLLCVVDFAVWCLVLLVRPITKWLAPPRALQSASASSASRAGSERQIRKIPLCESARRPSSPPPPYEPTTAAQAGFITPSSSITCPSSEKLLSHTSSDSWESGEGEFISELIESETEGSESTHRSEGSLEMRIKTPPALDIYAVTDLFDHDGNAVAKVFVQPGRVAPSDGNRKTLRMLPLPIDHPQRVANLASTPPSSRAPWRAPLE